MAKKPISDALQLGKSLRLSNGTELPVLGAASVRKLETLMELYEHGVGFKFAFLFKKGNETHRDALLDILHIMCGEKVDKDYILDNLTTADETGVYDEINRFLGLKPRDAEERTEQE